MKPFWSRWRKWLGIVFFLVLASLAVYFRVFLHTYAKKVLVMCWGWACSSEANNFGTFLFGATSAGAGAFYFFRVRKEKRLEKRSNIAEDSLITLENFMFQLKDWLSRSSSSFLYSRHSKAEKLQYQHASEEKKGQLAKMYEKDPYELHNHCENLKGMTKDFFLAKNRASHLENRIVDEQFMELEALLHKFPVTLCAFLQMKDAENMFPEQGAKMAEAWQFLAEEGPETVRNASESIEETLRKIMLFKE